MGARCNELILHFWKLFKTSSETLASPQAGFRRTDQHKAVGARPLTTVFSHKSRSSPIQHQTSLFSCAMCYQDVQDDHTLASDDRKKTRKLQKYLIFTLWRLHYGGLGVCRVVDGMRGILYFFEEETVRRRHSRTISRRFRFQNCFHIVWA